MTYYSLFKERNDWQFCADGGKLFHRVIVCRKNDGSCMLLAFQKLFLEIWTDFMVQSVL